MYVDSSLHWLLLYVYIPVQDSNGGICWPQALHVDTEQSDPSSIIMGCDPFIRSTKFVKQDEALH